jgi:Protein of unknown function (DUF3433)
MEGCNQGWKPVSMRAPTLISFAIASLVIAVLIEILAQRSQAAGALALSPTLDAIPPPVVFSYLFLPTIIAVIYSLCWSWIDLDVKRMQPWMELSRPDGATARNSLFLEYPFEFLAFVPFQAARRRSVYANGLSGTSTDLSTDNGQFSMLVRP